MILHLRQAEMFSKSLKSKAKDRWTLSILEKSIVKVIRDGLNACCIPNFEIRARLPCSFCHRWSGTPSEPGLPDIFGWIPARLLSVGVRSVPLHIEVKRPQNGVESESQKQFIERANRDGGIALFARDWDSVADSLRSAGVKVPKEL